MTATLTTYVNDIDITTRIVSLDCCECGLTYGLSAEFVQRRRDDHRWFYCPNGHSQHYSGKSDKERLELQLKWAREERDSARSIAQREGRRRAAAQGQVTKIKRRVGRGVCPCCNRTFADLARHMSGQHPDFVDAEAQA